MTDSFCIVKKHPDILKYVDKLQHENAEALSFYPLVTFEREIEKGRIFLALLNGEPAGYIYVGSNKGILRCHQVCIQYDARRRYYGACLVTAVEEFGIMGGANEVRLRCGFDLMANDFWSSLDYKCIDTVEGGIRRMRKINIWQKDLNTALFFTIGIEPATGKTDASIWRKHKQTGITTQFNRGASLKQYRALILENSGEEQ